MSKNIKMRQKNSSNEYDVLYPQSAADIVMLSKETSTAYSLTNGTAEDALNNEKKRYKRMSMASDIKSRDLRTQGNHQMDFAKSEANRILQDMKNPSAKELVEFYLDTTVAKVKKSASKAAKKAKKYATKAMSSAEKAVKKYATKAMPMAEKAANKAEKYATKTVKSVANKAKKYVVR